MCSYEELRVVGEEDLSFGWNVSVTVNFIREVFDTVCGVCIQYVCVLLYVCVCVCVCVCGGGGGGVFCGRREKIVFCGGVLGDESPKTKKKK